MKKKFIVEQLLQIIKYLRKILYSYTGHQTNKCTIARSCNTKSFHPCLAVPIQLPPSPPHKRPIYLKNYTHFFRSKPSPLIVV